MKLTEQQQRFFETFGYLHLPATRTRRENL